MSVPVVVFDLDGTLTLRDTSVSFLFVVAGWNATRRAVLAAGAWAMPDLAASIWMEWLGPPPRLGGVSGRWEGRLHQRMIARTLRGRSRRELEEAARSFADLTLAENLRPDALDRIAEHRSRGDRLVLASASLETYLGPLGERLGFDLAVGTRLELEDDVATGRVVGLPCWGAEKLRRVREAMGPGGGEIERAYGNARGDRVVLAAARRATVVPRLR